MEAVEEDVGAVEEAMATSGPPSERTKTLPPTAGAKMMFPCSLNTSAVWQVHTVIMSDITSARYSIVNKQTKNN